MTALEYKNTIKLYMLMLAVGIGIFVTIMEGENAGIFLWIIVGAVYFLKSTTDKSILMLVFMIPFEMWLPVNVLFFLAFIIELIKKKKITHFFLGSAMMFSFIIIQNVFLTNGNISIIIKVLITWIAVLYFTWQQFSDSKTYKICKTFRWSAIVYSVNILLVSWKYAGTYILESRLGGGQLSPFFMDKVQIPSENVIGLVMALALISTLLEMYYSGNSKYGCLLWFSGIGFLTKSTTFLVLFLIINIWYFIYFSPKKVLCILQIGAEILVLIAGFLAMYSLYPDFFGYFISRFSLSDKSNGRTAIFQAFNQNFLDGHIGNILFGYGTQNLDVLGNGGGLHNGLQGWYIQYGLVGFLLLMLIITILIRNCYVKRNTKESFYISILPLLTLLLGIQTMNVNFIWYLPVFLMMNLSKKRRGKNVVYYNNRRRISQQGS